MLVMRCYGFCTVLTSPRWLVSVGVKARVQRTGFRVVRESDRREKQEARESFAHWHVVFKQSDLGPAHRRLVESECPYGAEPHPCPWFLGPCLRHLIFHSFHES